MRLGLFGGTFDPIHYGHLLLAETAREECRLDQVWFVPNSQAPHKQGRPITDAQRRVEMLKLAIGGNSAFAISTLEIDRGGVSYTVDTLAQLRADEPTRELFLILGADSLIDLPTWREPARICELAMLVIARRTGAERARLDTLSELVSRERLAEFEPYQIEMPRVDLSASMLRRRVSQGLSIRYRTPRAVEKFIEVAGLYRAPELTFSPPASPESRTCGG
ncbi:MAG: nicotinate-nucleotide adenylyltransferase [Pirellulales bacterium]|nr:nicotinate-nucleotide adenylyltransferase [Pirellulales bacterium]